MFGDTPRKPVFFFLNENIEVVNVGKRENGGILEEQMEEKLSSRCVVWKRICLTLK